jgi:FkbM family methyltransferase
MDLEKMLFSNPLRKSYITVRRFFRNFVLVPPIRIIPNDLEKIYLGSSYGGKLVCKNRMPVKPFVISGGVGEDVSFDVEMIDKFDACVVLIDPTSKSKKHFTNIEANFGGKKKSAYNLSGNQTIESYQLGNVTKKNLFFHNVGIWENCNGITLYPPTNRDHSSYSINDLQRTAGRAEHIVVPTLDILSLMRLYGKDHVDILKLDIEGAEYEVLRDCFAKKIFPSQILVEIDEMYYPSISNYRKAWKVRRLLSRNGYVVIGKSQDFDYCLVRRPV